MRKKKLLIWIAAVLSLLMSVSAFAADKLPGVDGGSTRIDALCRFPDIKVSVPTTVNVFINPYEIPVEIDSAIEDGQIVSESSYIENMSEVPIQVSVALTGAVKEGSDMTLSSTSTKGQKLTSKKAFLFFEMKAVNNPDVASWTRVYNEEKHILVSTSAEKKRTNYVTLGAAEKKGYIGAFRLSGDCVANPQNEWTNKDGIDVKIAFTFTAVPLISP